MRLPHSHPKPWFLGGPQGMVSALALGRGPSQSVQCHLHSCVCHHSCSLLGPYCLRCGSCPPVVDRPLPAYPLPVVLCHRDLCSVHGMVLGPDPSPSAWPCPPLPCTADFLWRGRFERLAHDKLHAPLSLGSLQTSAIQSRAEALWPSRPATTWWEGLPGLPHCILGGPPSMPSPPCTGD